MRKKLKCWRSEEVKKKPLAWQLGFNMGNIPKNNINYSEKIHIPKNSFSNPKIQSKQYSFGWRAGKKQLGEC